MFKGRRPEARRMSDEVERTCPDCGTERSFYRSASTTLHLGTKVKYRCPECSWGFVTIDGAVDTAAD